VGATTAGDLGLVALPLDGIGLGEDMLVVALGIDSSENQHALAIREGSTENASRTTTGEGPAGAAGVVDAVAEGRDETARAPNEDVAPVQRESRDCQRRMTPRRRARRASGCRAYRASKQEHAPSSASPIRHPGSLVRNTDVESEPRTSLLERMPRIAPPSRNNWRT
jgi:hypothetical protein